MARGKVGMTVILGPTRERDKGIDYIKAMPDIGSSDLSEPKLIGAALIKDEARRLPDAPVVYRMFGEDGEALYVGKARSLKKRVIQYAQGRFHTQRIALMVD